MLWSLTKNIFHERSILVVQGIRTNSVLWFPHRKKHFKVLNRHGFSSKRNWIFERQYRMSFAQTGTSSRGKVSVVSSRKITEISASSLALHIFLRQWLRAIKLLVCIRMNLTCSIPDGMIFEDPRLKVSESITEYFSCHSVIHKPHPYFARQND